jgi:hypothetical protein
MSDNLPATMGMATGSAVAAIIPTSITEVQMLAEMIAAANWAPKSYLIKDSQKVDVPKVALGIMSGMEVGMKPIQSLQNIAIINGMPSIFGDAALGLVRSSGLLEDFKETPIIGDREVEGPDRNMKTLKGVIIGYHCWAKRKGQATPIEYTFTVDMAIKAKLWNKTGPWTEHPQRMLQMRARSWVLRDGFTEVLKGLSIAEEAQDVVITDVTPRPARARTVGGALDAFAGSEPAETQAEVETAASGPESGVEDVATTEAEDAEFEIKLPDLSDEVITAFDAGMYGPFIDWFTLHAENSQTPEWTQSLADAHMARFNAIAAISEKNKAVVMRMADRFAFDVTGEVK